MSRSTTSLLLALTIIVIAIDPALAGNKFTTIGGGVAGSDYEKLEALKTIGAVFGGFLVALGILSFLTRGRFEGLIGMVTGKTFEAVTVVPIVLIILGCLLGLFYFM
jgi:hypothetical protein